MDTKTKQLIQQHYSINPIIQEDENSIKFYPYLSSNTYLVAIASISFIEIYDNTGICIDVIKV